MNMSPSVQIALSAWAGVAVIGLGLLARLLHERKEPVWQDFAFGIPAAALIATWIYGKVHEGGLPRTGRLVRDGAFLVIAIAGLVGSARTLKTFWHDDDERAEHFGSSEGYITGRQLIPQRYKDLLSVVAIFGMVAAVSIYFFTSLFAPD